VLVDTHCHLGDARFDSDRSSVVERAIASGVGHSIVVADSGPAALQAMELAAKFGLSATAGVHPHEASSWHSEVAELVESALSNDSVVAVGETGLDYHYDFSPRDKQRDVFRRQLALAVELDMPAVVHAREADDDVIGIIRDSDAKIVLHSFCSGRELLDLAIERGDYVSFSGMVTFNSWKDTEAVCSVPADRILVETDSPYLAPMPHRGKRNEPSYVTHVARRVAEIRAVGLEQIHSDTTANAVRCFGNRVDPC